MKNILFPLFVLSAFLSVSCSDSLSPKADFKEEYALYGIMNVDTTFQSVYISHSYQVDGFDGSANKVDPAVEGADVKLEIYSITKLNNKIDTVLTKTYSLQGAASARNDVSRYNTSVKYYSTNNYKPSDGEIVKLSATLGNGVKLKSASLIPPISYLYYETSTMLYDPQTDEGSGIKGIKFMWRFLSSQFNTATQYFAPRLEIIYHKANDPANQIRVKVPFYFVPKDGSYLPLYPNVTTTNSAQFFGDSVERILQQISDGDSNKGNYVIDGAEFVLLLLDKNLASYLASENTFTDEFSIRIDASDFSNISGGLGMFGASATKKTKIKIAASYIATFGYKVSY
jgi:hypothetical protein